MSQGENHPFASFREFYPYYLSEHGNLACRRLHFVGSSLVLGCLAMLVRTLDLLRNPGDDHSKNVFDPAIRGKTDRFVQLYRKP